MKEAFREYAIEKGFADQIVIDNDTFSELSEITGCFWNRNGEWIVYDTDEKGMPFNIRKYDSNLNAYIAMAEELGFPLKVTEIIAKAVNRTRKK
mgnify:CR=1 FL=1